MSASFKNLEEKRMAFTPSLQAYSRENFEITAEVRIAPSQAHPYTQQQFDGTLRHQ
jgi:hypothetical protein